MEFSRVIIDHLQAWKEKKNRKPLILRGARQVGKTTIVKQFSSRYSHVIILNLEKPADLFFFEEFNQVQQITEALFIKYQIPSDAIQDTLLFIDEIQESPKAIQLLRYFYEDIPEIHVIAAGSLLEFAMREVKSFPIGRVEFLYMHPFNFEEYLLAHKQVLPLKHLKEIPIQAVAHQTLLDLFHKYAIIGGMPEIIKAEVENESLGDLPSIYEAIWSAYKDDVEKYAANATERRVTRHILNTAPFSLEERIKFKNFGKSNYRSREVAESFRNLEDAKVIRLIYPSTSTEVPIQADLKKSPRMQFLDTGIVNHSLQIQASLLSLSDLSSAYKGALIPHLITQELISLQTFTNHKPHFWVREKKQSNSELDLVIPYKEFIIPIEIKSGTAGTLKSLHQFMDESPHIYALRIYGGKFSIEKTQTSIGKKYILLNLPYYVGTQLLNYIEWFVENYNSDFLNESNSKI